MLHLWKRARVAYDGRIVWVGGHSKDVGNELAHKIAGEGAGNDKDACMGRWRPSDWGFFNFLRDFPLRFAAGSTAGCDKFKG